MDERAQIFLHKPELIIDIPQWMLPRLVRDEMTEDPGAVIVELAGRDSVAGAVAALGQGEISRMLPTYVYTGTEYGRWDEVPRALERLRSAVAAVDSSVVIHDLVVLGSPGFWRALCGSPLARLTRRYGFSPICVGCHLYLHAARLPLARLLGNAPVISGERHSHDGRIKINQLPRSLEAFRELAAGLGLELRHPLAEVCDGDEVTRLVGLPWPEGGEQLGCVLSGNYKDGAVPDRPPGLGGFLDEFAQPAARGIVEAYMEGRIPDHAAAAAEVLDRAEPGGGRP